MEYVRAARAQCTQTQRRADAHALTHTRRRAWCLCARAHVPHVARTLQAGGGERTGARSACCAYVEGRRGGMGALACTARRPRLTCFTCRPAIRIWTYMHARTHAHTHTRVERARMSIPPKFPTRALDCMHIHSRRAPRKSAARAAVHSLAWRPAGFPQLDHRIGRDVAALNARTSIDHMNARTLSVDAHACVDIGKQRAQRSAAQRAQRSRHRSARPPAPAGAHRRSLACRACCTLRSNPRSIDHECTHAIDRI